MIGPEAEFLEFLKSGKFMLQKTAQGEYVFYPRALPTDWTWVEASGRATVYSRTIIRQKPERGGDFCIAVVDLEEGPRLMTRILGLVPDQVMIGMAVRAAVEKPSWDETGSPVVIFRAANADMGAYHAS